MLWLALCLPRLSLEVFTRGTPGDAASVVVENRRVLVPSARAAAAGIRSGMTQTAAIALYPALELLPRKPALEAEALAQVAAWAGQFTSAVSLQPPDGLLLEVAGSVQLFGGAQAIARAARGGLASMGYSCALSGAPTPTGAWLLARAGNADLIERGAALRAALGRLPVAVLGCDSDTEEALYAIGAGSVAALLALPRGGLARRFGKELLATLDRALGALPDPRRFFTAPETFDAKLELPAEVEHAEALLFAARRLLAQLAGFLAARQGGIQRFTLWLAHRDRADSEISVGLMRPAADAAHLLMLLRERLGTAALVAPARGLRLCAHEILRLAPESIDLFADATRGSGEMSGESDKLIERLRARLGTGAVHGLALKAEHRPELAWRCAEPGARYDPVEFGPRPLWLYPAPAPLAEVNAVPHYQGALTLLAGPERIESGWWDGGEAKRDYFIAQNPAQSLLWVFRDRGAPEADGRWYLHGVFG
jgi:protein ImuB